MPLDEISTDLSHNLLYQWNEKKKPGWKWKKIRNWGKGRSMCLYLFNSKCSYFWFFEKFKNYAKITNCKNLNINLTIWFSLSCLLSSFLCCSSMVDCASNIILQNWGNFSSNRYIDSMLHWQFTIKIHHFCMIYGGWKKNFFLLSDGTLKWRRGDGL